MTETKSPVKTKKLKFEVESGDSKIIHQNVDNASQSGETMGSNKKLAEKFADVEQKNLGLFY